MLNWLRSLFGGRKPEPVAVERKVPHAPMVRAAAMAAPIAASALAQAPAPAPGSTVPADDVTDAQFISWLVGVPPPCDAPLREAEHAALSAIDALIASQRSAAELLPRAPAVIPQLMSALRQSEPSLTALVERVSKDLLLVAEVMRMARSAHYRAQGEVTDLARAISTLGDVGLHSAIARVVLRPLFESGGGELSARAAPRLWEHSEHKSRHCTALAAAAGLDPFDGCLAGLMHNAGWTVALRTLDRCETLPLPWTGEFMQQLVLRRDPLFGKVVGGWQVSAAVTALAAEASTPGFTSARAGLAGALLASDRDAGRDVLRAANAEAVDIVLQGEAELVH
jgi:HDOD domain